MMYLVTALTVVFGLFLSEKSQANGFGFEAHWSWNGSSYRTPLDCRERLNRPFMTRRGLRVIPKFLNHRGRMIRNINCISISVNEWRARRRFGQSRYGQPHRRGIYGDRSLPRRNLRDRFGDPQPSGEFERRPGEHAGNHRGSIGGEFNQRKKEEWIVEEEGEFKGEGQSDRPIYYCDGKLKTNDPVIIVHRANTDRCAQAYPVRVEKVNRRRCTYHVGNQQFEFRNVSGHELFSQRPLGRKFKVNQPFLLEDFQGEVLGFNGTPHPRGGRYSVLVRDRNGCVGVQSPKGVAGTGTKCITMNKKMKSSKKRKHDICLGLPVAVKTKKDGESRGIVVGFSRNSKKPELSRLAYEVPVRSQSGRRMTRIKMANLGDIVDYKGLASAPNRKVSKGKKKTLRPRKKTTVERRRVRVPVKKGEKRGTRIAPLPTKAPKRGSGQKPKRPIKKSAAPTTKKVGSPVQVDKGAVNFKVGDVVIEMVGNPSLDTVKSISKSIPKGEFGQIKLSRNYYHSRRLINMTNRLEKLYPGEGQKRAMEFYQSFKAQKAIMKKVAAIAVDEDSSNVMLPTMINFNSKKGLEVGRSLRKGDIVLDIKNYFRELGVNAVEDKGQVVIVVGRVGNRIRLKAPEVDSKGEAKSGSFEYLYLQGFQPRLALKRVKKKK